jgi:hypothetical protein
VFYVFDEIGHEQEWRDQQDPEVVRELPTHNQEDIPRIGECRESGSRVGCEEGHLLAKAKLADRINGEMNNRSTINKNEAGTNESMTVTAQSQDIVVNVINDTLVRHYQVTKQVIYATKNKSYRVYVMVDISKEHVANIVLRSNR